MRAFSVAFLMVFMWGLDSAVAQSRPERVEPDNASAAKVTPPASTAVTESATASQQSRTDDTEHRFKDLEDSESRFQTWLDSIAVGLGAMAIVLAVFSIGGVFLVRWIIDMEVKRKMEATHKELSARIAGAEGLLFGRMARDEDDQVIRPDFLDLAVDFSRRAYDELADNTRSPFYWRALNNLVYYLALRGNPDDRDEALKLAETLRTSRVQRLEARMAYAEALIAFSVVDRMQKLKEAAAIFERVIKDKSATNTNIEDAQRKLKRLTPLIASPAAKRNEGG